MRNIAKLAVMAGLFALACAGHASAYDRQVRLINESSYAIIKFFASNSDADDWGAELFDGYILFPNEDLVVDVDDGSGACFYDFLAVYDDFATAEDYGVDVCGYTEFRYTD